MHCLVTQAENRHAARIEGRDALIEIAHETLVIEFMAAAAASPLTHIPTPGWREGGNARLIDVLDDSMAGVNSDADWTELVGILAKSPEGVAFLKKHAEAYATFHEIDHAEGA